MIKWTFCSICHRTASYRLILSEARRHQNVSPKFRRLNFKLRLCCPERSSWLFEMKENRLTAGVLCPGTHLQRSSDPLASGGKASSVLPPWSFGPRYPSNNHIWVDCGGQMGLYTGPICDSPAGCLVVNGFGQATANRSFLKVGAWTWSNRLPDRIITHPFRTPDKVLNAFDNFLQTRTRSRM